MLAYKLPPEGTDTIEYGIYRLAGDPIRFELTPRSKSPKSWGDLDYSAIRRMPEGWIGLEQGEWNFPGPIPTRPEAWLPFFHELYDVFRPRDWAGRQHQAKWLADFAKDFLRWAKREVTFRGKTKFLAELKRLIGHEVQEDPSGKLGFVAPDANQGRLRIHVRLERQATLRMVVVTCYGEDGNASSFRCYHPEQPDRRQDYAWLPHETVMGLTEGFHWVEDTRPKPRFLEGIRPATAAYHKWKVISDEPEEEVSTPALEPVEEAASPAFTSIDVRASPPDAWVIPAAHLTLVDGRLAASTLRIPRGPVEVGEGYSPSWGPVEEYRAARPPEVEVGATALDGLGHAARGPPVLALRPEAL